MAGKRFLFWGKDRSPYTSWPKPGGYFPLSSRLATLTSIISDTSASAAPQADVEMPTLLIGIGKTGEIVFPLLLRKIEQDRQAKETKNLHAILISNNPPNTSSYESSSWMTKIGRNRVFRFLELQKPAALYAAQRFSRSARAEAVTLFQQVLNYKPFQEWLNEILLELGNRVQVFIFGSLSDPLIGLLGDVLQILQSFPHTLGRPGLFNRVSVFLLTDTPGTAGLSEEERFAAIREIGRLTFSGPHLMRSTLGTQSFIDHSLIDYLFLLDGTLPPKVLRAGGVNVFSMLAEAIFVLMHPSATTVWEHLLNDLQGATSVREASKKPVVHSLGVATLYIPIGTLREYLANRLASAAIFGEYHSEGLIGQDFTPLSEERLRSIVHSWLLDKEFSHPVFAWLLSLNGPADLDVLPELEIDYDRLFLSRLVFGLYLWLNQGGVSLTHTRQGLLWLEKHLSNCQTWLVKSRSMHSAQAELLSTRFERWKNLVQNLSNQVEEWQKALSDVTTGGRRSGAFSAINWRLQNTEPRSNSYPESRSSNNLYSLLLEQRAKIEEVLLSEADDAVFCSVLVNSERSPLEEVETYYLDSIRPELSQSSSTSVVPTYKRIRERLEWWIRLSEPDTPEILIACWPAEVEGRPQPLSSYCFRSNQIKGLMEAVLQLAQSQLYSVERDLTTQWFGKQVRSRADFLRRATDVYLSYDHNLAYRYKNASIRRSYVVSPDRGLALSLQDDVFPDTPKSAISILERGSSYRFTCLTVRMNLPLDSVEQLRKFESRYLQGLPDTLHIYNQERAAAAYENRWWQLRRERVSIPPEMAILLAEPFLVSLFCQALFTGLITTQQDARTEKSFLGVVSLPVGAPENLTPEFAALELAPVQADGLLLAMRRFTLELPNSQNAQLNPQHHFSPLRKERYMSLLKFEIERRLNSPSTARTRQQLVPELESWKRRSTSDAVAAAFLAILECEAEEPMWWKR